MAKTDSIFRRIGASLTIQQNRNLYTYLICIAIAATFWLLNALTKEYNSGIDLPIKYLNQPTGFLFEEGLPSEIQTEVKAFGFNLMLYRTFSDVDSVILDFQKATRSIGNGRIDYIIPLNPVLAKHKKKVPANIQLIKFWTDTLAIKAAVKSTKTLELRPNLNLSFEKQHTQDGPITLEPPKIKVVGPASVLDSLEYISLKEISLKDLNDDLTLDLEIELPERVYSNRKSVSVFIPVEQTTEMKFELTIKTKNVPDSLRMLIFPSKAQVTCELPLSHYEQLNKSELVLAVDYEDYSTENTRLTVKEEALPAYLKLKDFEPQRVDVIIRKR